MRGFSIYILFVCLLATACKKDSPNANPVDENYRSIFYKVVATIPSPADIERGIFADSISMSTSASNDSIFYTNFRWVNANLTPNYPGMSVGYDNDNLPFPHFSFTKSAFQNVPFDFELNHDYVTDIDPSIYSHMFLGRSDGLNGWNYFVNNEYPDDADQIVYSSHTSVRFTRRQEFFLQPSDYPTSLEVDGEATGYLITNLSSADPSKYVHRLDFTLRFEGLTLYP